MKTVIKDGTLVNEGKVFKAHLIFENGVITDITNVLPDDLSNFHVIDAKGKYVIPGAIDDQVHFREPGLTWKSDISDGSLAAAAGGVTSYMEMPNVKPPTTTIALLKEKQDLAAEKSVVNYSFYLGATKDNLDEIHKIDIKTTCGLKVFMGSSTGNMLVDDMEALAKIFAESPVLIATHCEDTPTINANLAAFTQKYGDDIPPEAHPLIRSREACLKSSTLAATLARKYNSRLHILHLSTAEEIDLLDRGELSGKRITGEACVHHLWFNDKAYTERGNFVKWNPAIKKESDREALLKAVNEGIINVVATDHAPHTLAEKQGKYTQAASGGPMIQHSLPVMLELMNRGEISFERIVEAMCHAPAELYQIEKRGFLRKGYKADICVVKKEDWKVDASNIAYRCGWSPIEGTTLSYKVDTTIVNGKVVYENGKVNRDIRGELLTFER